MTVIDERADGMMVCSAHGAILTVERFDDGVVAMWIAAPGENDGYSVPLDEVSRRRVAAFLLDGLS